MVASFSLLTFFSEFSHFFSSTRLSWLNCDTEFAFIYFHSKTDFGCQPNFTFCKEDKCCLLWAMLPFSVFGKVKQYKEPAFFPAHLDNDISSSDSLQKVTSSQLSLWHSTGLSTLWLDLAFQFKHVLNAFLPHFLKTFTHGWPFFSPRVFHPLWHIILRDYIWTKSDVYNQIMLIEPRKIFTNKIFFFFFLENESYS